MNIWRSIFGGLTTAVLTASLAHAQPLVIRCQQNADYKDICKDISVLDACSEEMQKLCCDCEGLWAEDFEICSFQPKLFSEFDFQEPPADEPPADEPPEEEPDNPIIDEDGNCVENPNLPDCIDEPLQPLACASANGFFSQINIASVTNVLNAPLRLKVEYRNLFGELQDSVNTTLAPLQKQDFIVNEMGLEDNSYGTVCVSSETSEAGAWVGGVTIYKPDTRLGPVSFGERFDYALFYPFTNPRTQTLSVPLNTFHLGTDSSFTVANWISITDAVPGDGRGLEGTLNYIAEDGTVINSDKVSLPDGGRFDYSGHEGIGGFENKDAVGVAQFVPAGAGYQYLLTVARYFYDCVGGACDNFLTAFNIPDRPGISKTIAGGVSTVGGATSVVEVSDRSGLKAFARVNIHNAAGAALGSLGVDLPADGTVHVIANQSGNSGFFGVEQVGFAEVSPSQGGEFISALSVFYHLDDTGRLLHAHAAPFVASPGKLQLTEFNSFISHRNELEVLNPSSETISADVEAKDYLGAVVYQKTLSLPPKAAERFLLTVPADSYGSVTVSSSVAGLLVRNYIIREGEYIYTLRGR